MQYDEILKRLKSLSNPEAVEGMAKYGITPDKTYGVSIRNLRKIAKQIGKPYIGVLSPFAVIFRCKPSWFQ